VSEEIYAEDNDIKGTKQYEKTVFRILNASLRFTLRGDERGRVISTSTLEFGLVSKDVNDEGDDLINNVNVSKYRKDKTLVFSNRQ
jgi:hypothetical protein